MISLQGVKIPFFKKPNEAKVSFEGNQNSEKAPIGQNTALKPALEQDKVSFSGPLTGAR